MLPKAWPCMLLAVALCGCPKTTVPLDAGSGGGGALGGGAGGGGGGGGVIDSGTRDSGAPDAGDAGSDAGEVCDGGTREWTGDILSGTRLRARVVHTDEGDDVFQRFHDTQLGIDCFFQLAADGVRRCVPLGPSVIRYTDATCSAGSAISQSFSVTLCPLTPGWAQEQQPGCPFTTMHYFRTTGTIAPPTQVWARNSDGSCIGPLAAGPGSAYFSVASEEPAATFVGSTDVVVRSSADIELHALLADDGAQVTTGLVDKGRQQLCVPLDSADGTVRCMPAGLYGVPTEGLYDDAQCTMPVSLANPGSCVGTGSFIFEPRNTQDCSMPPIRYFELGEKLTNPTLYQRINGGACTGPVGTSAGDLYSLGAELPPSMFHPASDAPSNGCQRIQPYLDEAEGVRWAQWVVYRDTKVGADCFWDETTDAGYRCLPEDWQEPGHDNPMALVGKYFTDSICTQPIDLGAVIDSCDAGLPAPKWLGRRDDSRCPPQWDVFDVGPVHTAITYQSNGVQCFHAAPAAGLTLYELGAPSAMDAFAGGASVVQ